MRSFVNTNSYHLGFSAGKILMDLYGVLEQKKKTGWFGSVQDMTEKFNSINFLEKIMH